MENKANYLTLSDYALKYNIDRYKLPRACASKALISEQGQLKGRIGKKCWYIRDLPPLDHPEYAEYEKKLQTRRGNDWGKSRVDINANFYRHCKKYLEEYLNNKQRIAKGEPYYTRNELAKFIGVNPRTITLWTEIGIKDYGKLPRALVKHPKEKNRVMLKVWRQTVYYYSHDEIVRFFSRYYGSDYKEGDSVDNNKKLKDPTFIKSKREYYKFTPEYSMSYNGFVKWARENIRRKSRENNMVRWIPFEPCEMQLDFYKNVWALKDDGTLKNKMIRTARRRGEMKTFDVVLIILFRFFNMPAENIVLVANSKEQADHVLFDATKEILQNSPNLVNTPGFDMERDLKKDTITLLDGSKSEYAIIKIITTGEGSYSNITLSVFSEVHKQRNFDFIEELGTSTRGVANSFSIIESIMTEKGTPYRNNYEVYLEKKPPGLYFQFLPGVDSNGDWIMYNPSVTIEELELYRATLTPWSFQRYFVHTLESTAGAFFSNDNIKKISYLGIDDTYGETTELTNAIKELKIQHANLSKFKNLKINTTDIENRIQSINDRLITVDSIYSLPATSEDLETLQALFKCEFIISMGLDRSEALGERSDWTVLATIAKGIINKEGDWIALILDLCYFKRGHSGNDILERIEMNRIKFGGIDQIDVETYQTIDLARELENRHFNVNFVAPTLNHQKDIFRILNRQVGKGRFKSPIVPIFFDGKDNIYNAKPDNIEDDVLHKELRAFIYGDPVTGKEYFGSRHKKKGHYTPVGKVGDDGMYAIAHALFAADRIDMTMRSSGSFSHVIQNPQVLGSY